MQRTYRRLNRCFWIEGCCGGGGGEEVCGKTIIMITHDPKAAEYATWRVHLDEGLPIDAQARTVA